MKKNVFIDVLEEIKLNTFVSNFFSNSLYIDGSVIILNKIGKSEAYRQMGPVANMSSCISFAGGCCVLLLITLDDAL